MSPDPSYSKLFFLAAELGAGDSAAQLALLACALPRERFAVTVGVLGPITGAIAATLSASRVPVLSLPVRHAFDLSGMRQLRHAVEVANPTVLHVWGPQAARLSRSLVSRGDGGNTPRLVVSSAAAPGSGLAGWLAARRVRRADRVIASGWAEGERYRRLGVRGERLTRIAPAVEPPTRAPNRTAFCHDVGAPLHSRLIFAGGRLDSAHGIKEAVTAFDMLRYESPDLQLVLTGEGPDRAAAEQLVRALAFDDVRVRFSGARGDLPAATRLAEIVWVTCRRGGEHLALRAMAAGRPVVAYHTPELSEVIEDGVTGFLVPPGDRAALAEKTHHLLRDPVSAACVGEAGRARAAERFCVARMAEQYTRVYTELTGV